MLFQLQYLDFFDGVNKDEAPLLFDPGDLWIGCSLDYQRPMGQSRVLQDVFLVSNEGYL